jgi:hypothetical protein
MTIKAVPTVSEPIYLQDWSVAVKELEGEDCPREKQAWVVVRQATEGDHLRASRRDENIEYLHQPDGNTRETVTSNLLDERMFQAYLVLVDAGNILDADDVPIFTFKRGPDYDRFNGGYAEFQNRWGLLPSIAADAIGVAVYTLNPHWDRFRILTQIEAAKKEAQEEGEQPKDRSEDTSES